MNNYAMPAELHRRVVLGIGKPLPRRAPSLALKLLMILLALLAACVLGSLAGAQGDGGLRGGALAGLEAHVGAPEKVPGAGVPRETRGLQKFKIFFGREVRALGNFLEIFRKFPLPPSVGSPQRPQARPHPSISVPLAGLPPIAVASLPRIPVAGLPDSAPLARSITIPEWTRSLSVSEPWAPLAIGPRPCSMSVCNPVDLREPALAAKPCFMTPGGCFFGSATWGWIGAALAAIAVLYVCFLAACFSAQATGSEDQR